MKTVKCWSPSLAPLVVVNEIIAEANKNKKTAAILLTVIVLSMNYIAQTQQHKLKLLWSSRLGHLWDNSNILLLFDPNGLRITSSKLMFDRCKTL